MIFQVWGLVAGIAFLGLLVAAGLHFKDPRQRGALLLAACAVAAAAWPVLLPYWLIERLVWRPLAALSTRRLEAERAKRAAGLAPPSASQ